MITQCNGKVFYIEDLNGMKIYECEECGSKQFDNTIVFYKSNNFKKI